MKKIKPCPFCGGDANITGEDYFWGICLDCGAEGPPHETKTTATESWNRRVKDED